MRNVLIILVLAAVCGGVGFIATAEIARRTQNAAAASDKRPETGDRMRDIQEGERQFGVAMENLRKRQTYAFIGASVGVVVGGLVGVVIARRLDRAAPAGPAGGAQRR